VGKGIGIAAMVLGIIAIFVPFVSIYMVWLAMILAISAAFAGEKPFSAATFAICMVNVLFLSPATMAELKGVPALAVFTIILFCTTIAGWVYFAQKAKKDLSADTASDDI
jgi:hypothetical protein